MNGPRETGWEDLSHLFLSRCFLGEYKRESKQSGNFEDPWPVGQYTHRQGSFASECWKRGFAFRKLSNPCIPLVSGF